MTDCVECGKPVPYQGRGKPRIRHVQCMTPQQKRKRKMMKSYMREYYKNPKNREKSYSPWSIRERGKKK